MIYHPAPTRSLPAKGNVAQYYYGLFSSLNRIAEERKIRSNFEAEHITVELN